MEGADVFIAYLKEEQEDADETKRLVEEKGRKCYLHTTDLKDRENCKKLVDEALQKFGGRIDILVNNAATQMMVDDIKDLSEYVEYPTIPSNPLSSLSSASRFQD